MYLGSVKFYKHLIYVIIVTVLVLALVGLGYLISLIVPKEESKEAINSNSVITVVDNTNKTDQNLELDDKGTVDKNDVDKIDDEEQDDSDSSEHENVEAEEPTLVDNFPDLYNDSFEIIPTDKRTAYLTFDDGPSENTEKILEILKEHNIKATFFVITGEHNSKNLELLKKINDEGHAIGIHSHSHEYNRIYDSKESFLEDVTSASNVIYEKTNVRPSILRLPGGSINDYNESIYQDLIDELAKRNFQYYDWNVSFEDAKKNTSIDEIVQSAMYGIEQNKNKNIIMLAHDQAKDNVMLEALKKVIDVLESYGYAFDKIDNSVEPITFLNKLDVESNIK